MASPRRVGQRIYARPSDRSGRSRYYYDLERRSFYNVPARNLRSQKLDVRMLLSNPKIARDFRVHKDGRVFFRGVDIGWLADTAPTQRLRSRGDIGERPPAEEGAGKYAQRILARNPDYTLSGSFHRGHSITHVFQTDRGQMFTVTTEA